MTSLAKAGVAKAGVAKAGLAKAGLAKAGVAKAGVAKAGASLTRREARRLAINAQGLAVERPLGKHRTPGTAALQKVMGTVGTIQLDAVNVLERTQYLVPFSRLGGYDKTSFGPLSGPGAPWFEYWGHAASLMPVESHPLFRWRMGLGAEDQAEGASVWAARRRDWREAHARYIQEVLAEVSERGPLAASQLSDPRRRLGEWWDRRSDGRRVLELLFSDGVVAAWRSPSFERVYDLTERVIPSDILALPTPAEADAQRDLVAWAARCTGVATVNDLANYFGMKPKAAALRVDELVAEGRLVPVAVEGWAQKAYMPPGVRVKPLARQGATLLSPFDSLIWFRERAERLFDVRYRIEIYVPAPQRTYGYYVLPLLWGERIVARFDLKSDRKGSSLLVAAAHVEPGESPADVAEVALPELDRLRAWLGLGSVEVVGKGDLAPALSAGTA